MLNLKQGGCNVQQWVERLTFFQKRPDKFIKYVQIGYHLEKQTFIMYQIDEKVLILSNVETREYTTRLA